MDTGVDGGDLGKPFGGGLGQYTVMLVSACVENQMQMARDALALRRHTCIRHG